MDRDPLDELRDANPVDPGRLPSASLARIRARSLEDRMVEQRGRRRVARPVAVGLTATLLGALAVAIFAGEALGPAPTSPGPTGPGTAFCVEEYSLESLATRGFAFDGTVSGVSGDSVTFTVGVAFSGPYPAGSSVTLTAIGMAGGLPTIGGGGLSLQPGHRYLVAGEDTFVWGCGFSQPYDEQVAADWANVFGR